MSRKSDGLYETGFQWLPRVGGGVSLRPSRRPMGLSATRSSHLALHGLGAHGHAVFVAQTVRAARCCADQPSGAKTNDMSGAPEDPLLRPKDGPLLLVVGTMFNGLLLDARGRSGAGQARLLRIESRCASSLSNRSVSRKGVTGPFSRLMICPAGNQSRVLTSSRDFRCHCPISLRAARKRAFDGGPHLRPVKLHNRPDRFPGLSLNRPRPKRT